MELAGTAIFLAILIGVPLGIYAGLYPSNVSIHHGYFNIWGEHPNFWQGVMLILLFSVSLNWLPSTGRGEVGHFFFFFFFFFFNLALFYAALLLRLTRANVMEVAQLDYIKQLMRKDYRAKE